MTTTPPEPTSYHEIFIPLIDVYEMSGPEVFSRLSPKNDGERNLIVVPLEFVERLDELKDNSHGAMSALERLQAIQRRQISSQEGRAICAVDEHCADTYVAFLDRKSSQEGKFSISELERTVRQVWSPEKGKPVLLTNKEKYHIKYGVRGLRVEEPKFLQVSADVVNEGIIDGTDELLAALCENKNSLSLEQAVSMLRGRELRLHQFIRFSSAGLQGGRYEFARVTGDLLWNKSGTRITGVENKGVRLLDYHDKARSIRVGEHVRSEVLGISPRDDEQYLAMQYGLLNPEVSLFFLCGSQGSGKTLLAYVAAVDQVLCYDKELRERRGLSSKGKEGHFKKIVLLKPNEVIGGKRREVGFLPGSLYDKLKNHLQPYIDAHKESKLGSSFAFEEMLRNPHYSEEGYGQRTFKEKIDNVAHLPAHSSVVEVTYSGFLRGRSFIDTILLVDEAQNFTPYEMRTILERAGEGCKVIVLGDPFQVDHPSCSAEINGLTHAINHYLGKPYVGLVTLTRNYRSQMSDEARSWRVFSR